MNQILSLKFIAGTHAPPHRLGTPLTRLQATCLAVLAWLSVLASLLSATPPALAQTSATTGPPSAPQLRIEAGGHIATVSAISIDPLGETIVTGSFDKTIRVWSNQTGNLLSIIRPPTGTDIPEGELYAISISADGKYIAAGGWTGYSWDKATYVYLFEVRSGKLIRKIGGFKKSVVKHIEFLNENDNLFVATESGIYLYNFKTGMLIDHFSEQYGDHMGFAFSKTGFLALSEGENIDIYYIQKGKLSRVVNKKLIGDWAGKAGSSLAFSESGQELAVSFTDVSKKDGSRLAGLAVLDSKTLDVITLPKVSDINRPLFGLFFNGREKLLCGIGKDVGSKYRYRCYQDNGKGDSSDKIIDVGFISKTPPTKIKTYNNIKSGVIFGVGNRIVSIDTREITAQIHPSKEFTILNTNHSLATNFNGKEIQFKSPNDTNDLDAFDLIKREQIKLSTEHTYPITKSPRWQNVAIYNAEFGFDKDDTLSYGIDVDDKTIVYGTLFKLRANGFHEWEQWTPGYVASINLSRNGKLVVAAYGDGTIRWHRLSDGQELLAFFPHADRKRWVLWTPSGYFDASVGGEDLIGWHVNRGADAAADFFPASQFRGQFHRPDVIDRVLDTLDEAEALKQADAARGSRPSQVATPAAAAAAVLQTLPPVVEVVSGTELRATQPSVTIRVRARTSADARVTGWSVRVNGQLQPEARGMGRPDDNGQRSDEREFTVTVPAQDSEIQVFATNRHATSTPAVVRVAWAGATPGGSGGGAFQIQPKLYILAVGVAQYQHADITKLGLPAKDAKDFAAALQAQKGKLYREVEVKLLTDAQATADAVVDGLDWLQKQVTQHDVGMVFLAGHGLNDATQGYTYLPVNADPDRLRRTGVPMDEFKKTLAALPGKAVFFLDTCHSGNVLGGSGKVSRSVLTNDVTGVINELASAQNGVVVFSSSTGRQLSYEDAAWGNGAFTKAVVEGLGGKANYQNTGRITHKMLDLYISERVKELTRGRQSPVTQAPGGVPDFPLAVVK